MTHHSFDHEIDILVVGSGAGALTAALTAADEGAQVLVTEKCPHYGGTSALSGGGVWVPNNPYMAEAGAEDTPEDAALYMNALIGDDVSASRKEAFLREAPRMISYLRENTRCQFQAMPYCDYFPEKEGGKPGYRTLEPLPFHARHMGGTFNKLRRLHNQILVLGRMCLTMKEGRKMLTQAKGWIPALMTIMLRYWTDIPARLKGKRDRRTTMGAALVARLRTSLLDRNIPLWLDSPMKELIEENGEITGAVIDHDGKELRVRARKGVILGAGGFERNQAMREQYLPKPTNQAWSSGNEGNTGDAIRAGKAAGAALDLMDAAWWGPTIPTSDKERPYFLFAERSLPGLVIVNKSGKRFANEALPYLEAGQALYDANTHESPSVPALLVFDSAFRKAYPLGPLMPGNFIPDKRLPKHIQKLLFKASTPEELAKKADVEAEGLKSTLERHNNFAPKGEDPDFGRGESLYDRYYGDPANSPNPCLASINKPPYYAMALYPGDIGTKGGLLTNDRAQVIKEDGSVIKGLYAIGNTSASVMGRTYPGAGGTLGPAMTFGFIAARHAMKQG